MGIIYIDEVGMFVILVGVTDGRAKHALRRRFIGLYTKPYATMCPSIPPTFEHTFPVTTVEHRIFFFSLG